VELSGSNGGPSRPVAVITGGSSGIGHELAKVFAATGFSNKVQVATSGITPDSVQAKLHRKKAEPGSAS
jgi:NAD(P)-dependent dehydrogenase (short-subunit alcohol dehydrogenase family)